MRKKDFLFCNQADSTVNHVSLIRGIASSICQILVDFLLTILEWSVEIQT